MRSRPVLLLSPLAAGLVLLSAAAGPAASEADPADRRALRVVGTTTAAEAAPLRAVAEAAVAAADAQRAERIVLVEPYSDDFRFVNVGSRKEGPGDYYVFRDDLYDQSGSRKVGVTHGQCTLNYRGINTCAIDVVLTGRGTITFSGPQTDYPFTLPITGGTWDFKQARGVVVTENIDRQSDRLVLRILP